MKKHKSLFEHSEFVIQTHIKKLNASDKEKNKQGIS